MPLVNRQLPKLVDGKPGRLQPLRELRHAGERQLRRRRDRRLCLEPNLELEMNGAAHPSDLLLRTANYRASDKQIVADLKFASSRMQGPITATSYDRERRLVYQETR